VRLGASWSRVPLVTTLAAAPLLVAGKDGSRADVKSPEESLVLLKPTRQLSHQGGKRLEDETWQYRMGRQWIADGAKYDPKQASRLVRFEITPRELVLAQPSAK
jgi:hypothetical protein